MSKILDSAVELNKIQYIAGNNTLNFTATPITGGSPIVDATAGVYANGAFAQANAAFQSANNVAPQVQPAFDKANAAFNKANSSVSRQSFLANTNQTLFITNGYNIGYVDVFVNGIKLYSAEDFTATDGANVSIITPVLTQNDVVEIINWGGTAEPIARVDQYARDYVNNAWSTANSAYNFANSVYGLANNAANSAASSIPLTGSANISGNLIPITSNTYYLGSSSNRWHSLYVGPGSIDLGGLILSNTNGTLSVSAPGAPATPIAGEDTWVRAQANASFNKANSAAQYDANTTSTGSLAIPIGTTAQRPAAAANGQIRYNTTLGRIEAYLYSAGWTSVLSDQYTVEYLIVAGGGAGAGGQAGEGSAAGGGAGGLLQGSFTVNPQVIYTVTVGAGGSSGPAGDAGNNGSNSSAFSQTAIGGGKGSQGHASSGQNAGNGGSGGGGGYLGNTSGSGTPGQGYPGGNPSGATGSSGGGGAGAAGTPATNSTAGPGGIGVNWQSLGTYYAGGGGGGRHLNNSNVGSGGLGGGGDGGQNTNSGTAPAGGTNTGGGGGGGGENPVSSSTGGAGGSGIVILRYQGAQRGTGGTVTSSGGYTYHTFTGSGSFTA